MKSAILALVAVLGGCAASPTATTTTTAADLPGPAAREAAPVMTESPADERPNMPNGELVCRAKSPLEGTIELYVDGPGEEANASLRTVAPSGAVTVQRLRAHRHKGLVFADEPSQTDLVAHAATVATHDGKKMIRLGEAWSVCE